MKRALAFCLLAPLMLALPAHPGRAQAAGGPPANVPAAPGQTLAISPPFPDVPKGHWAYQSVETLRKAGILRGDGSGPRLNKKAVRAGGSQTPHRKSL